MRISVFLLTSVLLLTTSGQVASKGSDEALERVAQRSAAAVLIRHKKARKALLNMSRDRLFKSYFASDDVAHRNLHSALLASRSLAMAKKLDAQTFTLLDKKRQSIVKVVNGEVLGDDEVFELQSPESWLDSMRGSRGISASPIYYSSHLDSWVIAHVRSVRSGNGRDAVLHAEFELDSFRKSITRKSRPERIDLLAVTQDGWVVYDSRNTEQTLSASGSTDPSDNFKRFELGGMSILELAAAYKLGNPIYDDNGIQSEVSISKAENWYLLAIGSRIQLGSSAD